MSYRQPPNALASSSKLPSPPVARSNSSTKTSHSSKASKRPNPYEAEEGEGELATGSPPPVSAPATKRARPSPPKGKTEDDSASTKTSSWQPDWNPKDEVQTRETILKKLVAHPKHPQNPITTRTNNNAVDVVVSASSGHQTSAYNPSSAASKSYFQAQQAKMVAQQAPKKDEIFKGVRVWLDGYLGPGVTDLELKREVTTHGGAVSHYPSASVTHILTAVPLAGSKNHAFLTKSKGWKPFIVNPQWVYESIETGKRVSERPYAILAASNQPTIGSLFKPVDKSSKQKTPLRSSSSSSIPSKPKPSPSTKLVRSSSAPAPKAGRSKEEAISLDDD